MPFRQIFVLLLSLIAIVGAALFVLSWDGDDDTAAEVTETDGETDSDADDASGTTSTSTTTTVVPVTTSIPVECGSDDPVEDPPTETAPPDEAGESDEAENTDEGEDEPEELLVPTLGQNSSLSTVGLDEVTFGLTVNQAREAAGTEFDNCGPVNDCYRVTPVDAPSGISFVVHDGTIERADIVGDSPITTVSGAGIGTTDDELTDLFGDRLERVDLGAGSVDVIFVPSSENDAEFRVAFTTVDGVVETLRSGRVPLVLEADPCT